MSKQTKDIPPIPTILDGPPASPPSLIPKINPEEHCLDASRYSTGRYPLPRLTFICKSCGIVISIQPLIVPIHFTKVFCPLCRTLYAYATQDCLPKLRSPEYGPIIIDESVGINRIELDPATAARWYGETDDPPDIIKQLQARTQKKINDRHNAIDLLYQMRYVCRCVAPEPENGWCKYCGRLLQDE